MTEPILKVDDLAVEFDTYGGTVKAVRGVSFEVERGQTLAIVGESGCGKSVTVQSLMGLIPTPPGRITSGSAKLNGREILGLSAHEANKFRGVEIGMIFQDPMTSLNPTMTIGNQIAETLKVHRGKSHTEAFAMAIDLLERAHIPEAAKRARQYPFEFSGGMLQRAMIAQSLACNPSILIADEPTTALDVTIQAQILELMQELQRSEQMSIVLITHDLGVVAETCDRVIVMYAGRKIEEASVERLFADPRHPYTQKLLNAHSTGAPEPISPDSPVVAETEHAKVWFPIQRGFLKRTVGHVKAVNDATLRIRAGETVGIVGESGSGKSTLAMAMMRLISSEGKISFEGRDLNRLRTKDLRSLRSDMQIVFQDPYGSLSPRMTCAQIIAEGLEVHGAPAGQQHEELVRDILVEVGLDPTMMHRYPHEFSGGQRQRIAIARAMVLRPKFVVLDEPTSALDMTVQVQIVDLLRDLQKKYGLAYLFISHDLKVVRAMSHYVLVMKDGDIVEEGPVDRIFEAPQNDYTRKLMHAALDT